MHSCGIVPGSCMTRRQSGLTCLGLARSVSTEYRWLNELVGHVSGMPSQVPLAAFRFVHLEHHKHTNDKEKDP
jgi:hypothetical protein